MGSSSGLCCFVARIQKATARVIGSIANQSVATLRDFVTHQVQNMASGLTMGPGYEQDPGHKQARRAQLA